MDLGLAGTNEYLEQWRLGEWEAADGTADNIWRIFAEEGLTPEGRL